jgi:Tfp pilus assembly protein PilF
MSSSSRRASCIAASSKWPPIILERCTTPASSPLNKAGTMKRSRDPAHANAHSNLGVLLRATGKPAEAEAEYRPAIQLNPDHIDAYTNLGILLNGLKRTRRRPRVIAR